VSNLTSRTTASKTIISLSAAGIVPAWQWTTSSIDSHLTWWSSESWQLYTE